MKHDIRPAPPMTASAGRRPASSAGDMLYGTGSKLLYAATRVAVPPLALAHMGLAEYGLWAACFVIVGYIGMAASGFALVVLRHTARHHAAGDVAAIGRLLSTGLLAMGALALALLGALWLALPPLLDLFKVDPGQQALARVLWAGTLAVFLADMSLGVFGQVLHAVGRVRHEQTVWMAAFVLETALIVGFLHAGLGVLGMLVAFGGRYAFSVAANAMLAWRALPGLRLSWRDFDPSLLRDFAGFGAGMQLSGLVATALHSADRLVAGAWLGPAAMATVDLAAKLPVTAASIGSGASMVAVSSSARLDTGGSRDALLSMYRDATRITVAALAVTLPFLAWFAEPLTRLWLGPVEAQRAVAPLLALVAVGLHLHMLTGPVNAVARGRGCLGADFTYHGVRIVALAIALAVTLAGTTGGLQPLVSAMVAAQGAAAIGYLVWAHRRLCGSWHGLGASLAAPTAAAHALAALFATAAGAVDAGGRAAALASLALPALLWLPAIGALLAATVLTPGERRHALHRLRQPLSWRTA